MDVKTNALLSMVMLAVFAVHRAAGQVRFSRLSRHLAMMCLLTCAIMASLPPSPLPPPQAPALVSEPALACARLALPPSPRVPA